jgi:hypothetical protein
VCVNPQKQGAVEFEPEHQSLAEKAGAAEHAPHYDRTKRHKQVANEFGVHWAVPGFRLASADAQRSYDTRRIQ